MIILNTQGIVLKAVRYKENDVILTLFTRKLGKVSAIAKGAKRNKSSLLSSAQLFSYANYTLKRKGNMYTVNQSDTIKSFYDISYDIEAFSYATYITKLVEGSTCENQTNNRLFILLAQTLYLYTQENTDKKFITRAFELKFLDYIGFRPVVNRCSSCGSKSIKSAIFNIYEGGLLCDLCSENTEENIKLDVTTIKLMEYILNNDILTCSKAKVSKYITYELEKVLKQYLNVYIDNVNFKSLYFLKDIENDFDNKIENLKSKLYELQNTIFNKNNLMVFITGEDNELNLLKENKDIGCGVHMTLSCNKPLNNKFKSLVDENGMFHRRINEEVVNKIDLDELYYEFCSQIDRVKNAGVEISHLDSHHHVHTIPHFKDVIKSIMDKYNLKIRGGLDHKFDYKERVIPCIDSFYDKNVDVEFFNNNIEEIKSYDVCDLMTHPAFIDNYLLNSTSYAINRAKEYEILTNKKIKKILNENEIVLTNYKNI